MNIALIGKTGSGKSTVAKHLSWEFGHKIVNSDILREYIEQKCNKWQMVEEYLKDGKHVPDNLIVKALENRLSKYQENEKLIIDNLPCIAFLYALEKQYKIDYCFYFEISDDVARGRVLSRARENNVQTHLKNRADAFTENFPKLEQVLGNRLIRIDARQSIEAVRRQIVEFICVASL